MNQTTIEKANSIIKKIEMLKDIKHATDPTREHRISGIGIGYVNAPNHIYYKHNLLGRVGSVDEGLLERVATIAIYNEACRLLEEAKAELINIGVVTIRETPKVRTSKLKKILNRIF